MAKKYEVTVDGQTEEVTTKKEVQELVLGAALEGGEHEVSVELVDTNAQTEETSDGEAVTSNPDNPTGAISGGQDAQGIQHIR